MRKARHPARTILFCAVCVTCVALHGCAERDRSKSETARAEAEMEALRYEEAIRLADAAAKNGREARRAYRLKGIALLKTGRYEEADEAFARALSLSDGVLTDLDFDISMYRAYGFRKRGLYAEADAVYDNILALRPDDARALFAKGCNLLATDQVSDAYRCFDGARKAAGGSGELSELYVQIYRALDSAGYREAGFNQLEAALGDPQLSQEDRDRLLYYLGRTETETGLSPVEEYNRTGLDHMERGEYELATEAFEAGLSLQEEDLQQALLRNRIAAYEYAGNFGTAAALMEEYAARFPEDKMAARELVFLRTR